jgi:uncharacterized protein (DUF1697 family)
VTRHAAFLRGVNLGRRQVKSAELRAAFEEMGLEGVKTLLASGNVLFEAGEDEGLQTRIERGLQDRFGFAIGTVLRRLDELRAQVERQPFGGRSEDADTKLYVLLFAELLPDSVQLVGLPNDFDIVGRTPREVFVIAHRKPNGRYGEGMVKLEKQVPKGALVTTRNWNTIIKAAA